MKIVIDIPEAIIKDAKDSPNYYPSYLFEKIWKAVAKGTVLPKGHGRLIDESQITGTFTWDNGYIECFAPTIIEADRSEE
jgi:hypothetical protein